MRLNIRLDLDAEQARQHILEGLDSWVQLGLLSDDQVRKLAESMSEPMPTPQTQDLPQTYYTVAGTETSGPAEQAVSEPKSASPSPNKIAQALRSLLEEFSVIWLLFLGVFLVVVSSGVLAASQWQSFSAVGQYAILLAYTLVFWGASTWTQQQERLQNTAKMLTLTTVLLIPINFWMMDALGVWQSASGLGVSLVSALLLSGLLFKLLTGGVNRLNMLGLSWLHLAWIASAASGWTLWPVVATYVGTVGTATNLAYRDQRLTNSAVAEDSSEPSATAKSAKDEQPQIATHKTSARFFSFDTVAVSLSVLILLFRSLFIAQVSPHQLGLAAGICGCLWVWLNRNRGGEQQRIKGTAEWRAETVEPGLNWPGLGLLLLGWIVCVDQPLPWQVIAVSLLALWSLWIGLKRSWQKGYWHSMIAVAAQAYWLLGAFIPDALFPDVLTPISNQLSSQTISEVEWTSLAFFPFLWGLLWCARQFRQRQKPALSVVSESVALALGVMLFTLGSGHPFTRAVGLLLSAVTLLAIVLRRPNAAATLVTLTHGVGLGAIAACIYYIRPDLSISQWGHILLYGGIAEFALHLGLPPIPRNQDAHVPTLYHWRQNTWAAGPGLFALAYPYLLDGWDGEPQWTWLAVPITLAVVANHRRALFSRWLAKGTILSVLLQTPYMQSWRVVIISFAVGTLCLFFSSRVWRSKWSAFLMVGSSLTFVTSIASYGAEKTFYRGEYLFILWTVGIGGLWILARALQQRSGLLKSLYQWAANAWGTVLMLAFLLLSSLIAAEIFPTINRGWVGEPSVRYLLLATTILAAVLIEAIHHRPAEWRYLSLAWTAAITFTIAAILLDSSVAGMAIMFLGLALLTQLLGDVWVRVHPPYRSSWHIIPIAYAAIGVAIGHSTYLFTAFSAVTGLYTIAASILLLNVGRRSRSESSNGGLNLVSYAGLAALSIGAYELLVYQMSQASGGQVGDGFTLLAILAAAIAFLQKLLSPVLLPYLRLPKKGLLGVSQAHWAFGSMLAVTAALSGLSQPTGITLWTGTVLLLAAYALITGNRRWTTHTVVANHSIWTSLGILQSLLCVVHNRFVWFPDRLFLITWGGVMACGASFVLYQLPWERLGWPLRPWRLLALWLPLSVLGVAITHRVPTQSLLIVGAFYAWMAKQFNRVRLSYLSVFLFDWALLRYLDELGWLTSLVLGLVMGASILYVAEVEPYFQELSQRQQRHWLRSLASALIGLTALYQAEVSEPMLAYAAITLALGIGLIFAGLALKVRAFLYVGTLTFVLQVIRVLWLFISTYSLVLWAVGLVLGLVFIWVAATFESRRSQVTQNLQSWNTALQTWD